jgi:hypothetical protein
MKILALIICVGFILLIFYGCNQEQEKNTESNIPLDIPGSWLIKEARVDISSQNILLSFSEEGTWVMKRGGDTVDFGIYEKNADLYIFTSERNGEKFTVNASAISNDIMDMKIKSDKGMKIEISALKPAGGLVPNAEAVPSRSEIQNLSEQNKCEQTEKMMKAISVALEAYATDWSSYPSCSFDSMKAILTPFYIKDLPLIDAWGNRWIYELFYDKNQPSWQRFRLISLGSDRMLSYTPTEETSTGDDIVIVDSAFIKRCSQERR